MCVLQVPLSPGVSPADHHFVDVVVRKRGKATMAAGSAWQYDKFDTPRLVAVTRDALNSDVHQQLNQMAEHMLSSCEIPPPWSFEISAELDQCGMKGGSLTTWQYPLGTSSSDCSCRHNSHGPECVEVCFMFSIHLRRAAAQQRHILPVWATPDFGN